MKITTQRSLLWTINFVIVFALLGCVFLMMQKSGKFRREDQLEYLRRVEEALDVKVDRENMADSGQAWARFKTPLDKNFHFEGYVKPPEPESRPTGPTTEAAPKLETLIAVNMLLAPAADTGPDEMARGAAQIKIISKGNAGADAGVYTYVVGDVIGLGLDFRDDGDPILEKWGPCRLLAVRPDAIVCAWNKGQDEVEVRVDLATPSKTEVWITEGDSTLFGSEAALHGKEEIKGSLVDREKLTKVTQMKSGTTLVQWTERGFEALEEEGEQLLDQVETESASGGDGLKIKSLPSRLSEFGIQNGDVIVQIDDQPVRNKENAVNYVRKTYKKKTHYNVTVLRDGRTRQIQVDVPSKLSDAQRATRNLRFGQ